MDNAFARWTVLIAGLLVAGGACWLAVGSLHSARGIPGPGVFDAVAPVPAAMALLGAFVVATVVAAIVSRLLNPIVGLFVLGAGLGVISMRSGTIRDACFDGGSLVPLAIEGIIWAVLIALASIIVHHFGRDEGDMGVAGAARGGARGGCVSGGTAHGGAAATLARVCDPSALKVAAIGAVAIVGVWLLITSAFKGQAIGAAIVGGLLAGHVAKRAAPDGLPVLLFATPILFIAIAQLVLALSIADPADAFVHGSIPNLVAVMPLDLVSGSIVGVAIGIGLAKPSH